MAPTGSTPEKGDQMKYTYFIPSPETPEIAKKMYRALMIAHHPDFNPGVETATAEAQAINAEYASVLSVFALWGERARQEAAHAEGKKTTADYIDLDQVVELLRESIERILNLNMTGIEIEVCGLWVWVGGNTFPVRKEISAAGYKWAPAKKMWYFAGCPSMGRGGFSMSDIRTMHGSQKINTGTGSRKQDQPAEEKKSEKILA